MRNDKIIQAAFPVAAAFVAVLAIVSCAFAAPKHGLWIFAPLAAAIAVTAGFAVYWWRDFAEDES